MRHDAEESDRTFMLTMTSMNRRAFVLALIACSGRRSVIGAQAAFSARELSEYRLTDTALKRFAHATRVLAASMRADARFADQPLLTKDIVVSGDAPEMASQLQARLDAEPMLAAALFAADISSREYATFALALFAARLAHGFVKSGAMRRVPPGVAADNVAFISAHEVEIAALLKALNLE